MLAHFELRWIRLGDIHTGQNARAQKIKISEIMKAAISNTSGTLLGTDIERHHFFYHH